MFVFCLVLPSPGQRPALCSSGVHPAHGAAVRLPVRAGPVQVAALVAPADREAEDHLGLQDPVPGRAVSSRRRQDPVRGRRPGSDIHLSR